MRFLPEDFTERVRPETCGECGDQSHVSCHIGGNLVFLCAECLGDLNTKSRGAMIAVGKIGEFLLSRAGDLSYADIRHRIADQSDWSRRRLWNLDLYALREIAREIDQDIVNEISMLILAKET